MKIFKKNKKNDRYSAGVRDPGNLSKPKVKPSQYYRPVKKQEISTKNNLINRKTRSINFSKIINVIIVIGFISLFGYSSTLTTNPAVQVMETNITYRSENDYKSGIKSVLDSRLLNKSKLLVDAKKVEDEIGKMYPEIEEVALIVPIGGRNPKVVLKPSVAVATIKENNNGSVITNSGILVKDLGSSPVDNLISVVLLNLDLTNFENGSRILTTGEVDLVKLISLELKDLQVNGKVLVPSELIIDFASGGVELSFVDYKFSAKLSSRSDIREEIGSLKATLRQLSDSSILPVEYIDVRVPGRVFVK